MVATQLADNVKQKIANYNGTRVFLDYVDYISICETQAYILILSLVCSYYATKGMFLFFWQTKTIV